MIRRDLPILSVTLCLAAGCTEEGFTQGPSALTSDVAMAAAFAELDHVDVYSADAEYVTTLDASSDFRDTLALGTYYMSFVASSGQTSFTDDGRIAFAPMGTGFIPVDGPFEVDGVNSWQVEVDNALEANARLTRRVQLGDESLRSFKDFFPDWQAALPADERDLWGDEMAAAKAYSTSYVLLPDTDHPLAA